MPFPLTCDAVGDAIALVKLAKDNVVFFSECRGSPAECQSLQSELALLESLLDTVIPAIEANAEEKLRNSVLQQMEVLYKLLLSGLNKIACIDLVESTAPTTSSKRRTFIKWTNHVRKCVEWQIRHSADTKKRQAEISRALQPLMLSILLAFNNDTRRVLDRIRDALEQQQQDVDKVTDFMVQVQPALDAAVANIASKADVAALSGQMEERSRAASGDSAEVAKQLTSVGEALSQNIDVLASINNDTTEIKEIVNHNNAAGTNFNPTTPWSPRVNVAQVVATVAALKLGEWVCSKISTPAAAPKSDSSAVEHISFYDAQTTPTPSVLKRDSSSAIATNIAHAPISQHDVTPASLRTSNLSATNASQSGFPKTRTDQINLDKAWQRAFDSYDEDTASTYNHTPGTSIYAPRPADFTAGRTQAKESGDSTIATASPPFFEWATSTMSRNSWTQTYVAGERGWTACVFEGDLEMGSAHASSVKAAKDSAAAAAITFIEISGRFSI
ncbi:hypothetical protein BKA62DRAFT_700108 [Auriculariales sp. MPI-PUGE-AT-0066]|nr:hypothetical protein BKA62DRAFT_700108 [Auriculariales sp. MPI-PUGE-AT-0066]